jgi:hypothetical protein
VFGEELSHREDVIDGRVPAPEAGEEAAGEVEGSVAVAAGEITNPTMQPERDIGRFEGIVEFGYRPAIGEPSKRLDDNIADGILFKERGPQAGNCVIVLVKVDDIYADWNVVSRHEAHPRLAGAIVSAHRRPPPIAGSIEHNILVGAFIVCWGGFQLA